MPERLYEVIGEAIRKRRDIVGMTQTDLGVRLELSRTSVTNIECGRQSLTLHHLYRAAEALGVGVCDLLPPASMRVAKAGRSADLADLLDRLEAVPSGRSG